VRGSQSTFKYITICYNNQASSALAFALRAVYQPLFITKRTDYEQPPGDGRDRE